MIVAYCTMPYAALAAANDRITVMIVTARSPVMKRYTRGTVRNSTSCLQSTKLTRGSRENAADTSVMPAYAASGQKNAGTSTRSWRTASRIAQQATAAASRIWAMAIENNTAPAMPNSASVPSCSARSDGAATARA